MGRLVAAKQDIQKLIEAAENGNRTAALELAQTYKCESVEELLGVVCPLAPPSVEVFDCCADAMALKTELAARRRPVLDVK